MLDSGTRLGPYEVLSSLGAGGMGEVYRARDTRLGRDVALKVLPDTIDATARERFQREAKILSGLNHPHIAAVYDVGESNGRSFLVMELVEGTTLREYVRSHRVAPSQAAAIGAQIADALEAAHAKGVIHRDVKPGNVVITDRGDAKVLDFGLARRLTTDELEDTRLQDRLTAAGTIVGTPHYMAPEVLQGWPANARSDIWALGVVLYELLAGGPPFDGKNVVETSSAILRDSPPALPSSVPARLRAVVARCLMKQPAARYPDAGELRAALLDLQTGAGARGIWRWTAAAGAAAVVFMLIALIVSRRSSETPIPRTSTGGPASTNQDANDAFELAMQLQSVQNDIPRGNQMLERALSLDPRFAEAHRYHAFNYLVGILNGYSNDASLLYKAEEELRRAAQEDPGLPSLPSAFTAAYLMQGRRELVPTEALDRVLKQTPAHRDSRLWRAIVSWLDEDNRRAREHLTAILQREPLFGAARMFLGEMLRTEGEVDAAIREQQKVLDQAPSNISAIRNLVHAYLDAGNVDAAANLLEASRGTFERNFSWRSTRALVLAREGNRDAALRLLDEATKKFLGVAFPSTLDAAEVYALAGDSSAAIEWVDRAVRNGDGRIGWFRRNARLAAIRDDPRFQRILESVEARRRPR